MSLRTLSNADIARERRFMEAREDADDAGDRLSSAATDLSYICERHPGDYGRDADALDELTAEIRAIEAKVKALLGPEAEKVRNPRGEVIGLIFPPRKGAL